MSHTFKLPNGDTATIEGELTPEQAQDYLKNNPPPGFDEASIQAQAPEEQATPTVAPSLVDKATDFLMDTPGRIERNNKNVPSELWGTFTQGPVRTVKNLASSATKLARDVGNFPETAGKFLAGEAMQPNPFKPQYQFPKEAESPNLSDEQIDKFYRLGAQQPGDKTTQGVIGMLGPMKGSGAAADVIRPALSQANRVVQGTNKVRAYADSLGITDAEATAKKASDAYEQAVAAEKQAKEAAHLETGKETPKGLNRTIAKSQPSLTLQQQILDASQHQIDNVPKAGEAPEFGTEHIDEARAAQRDKEAAENDVNQAQSNLDNAHAQAAQTKDVLDKAFVNDKPHDVAASTRIQGIVKGVESKGSNDYKGLLEDLDDAKFEMAPESMQKHEMDMDEYKAKYKIDMNSSKKVKLESLEEGEENPELNRVLSKAPTASDVSARDFLTKYKAFRNERFNLLKDIKEEKDAIKQANRHKAFNDSEELDTKIKDTLNAGLGEHKDRFNRINNFFSNIIFPLRNNKHVRSAQRTGMLPKDMADAFRGEAEGQPGVGQERLREMVKSDPELVRNVLGQQYHANINKLLSPNAAVQPYLDSFPKVKEAVANHNANLAAIDHHTEALANAKENQTVAANTAKDALSRAREIEKENNKAKTEYQARSDELNKQRATHQLAITKAKAEINKHEVEIANAEKHLPILRQAAANKKQSLASKNNAEMRLKSVQDSIKNKRYRLTKLRYLTNQLYWKLHNVPGLGKVVKYGTLAYLGGAVVNELKNLGNREEES